MTFFALIQRQIYSAFIFALFVTFFASFPIFAQSQKKEKQRKKQEQYLGTNAGGGGGAGGGGAIVCEGQQPVLTDFWEAEQQEKASGSDRKVETLLRDLRTKNLEEAIHFMAEKYELIFLQTGKLKDAEDAIRKIIQTAYQVIEGGDQTAIELSVGYSGPTKIIVDTNYPDSGDSGYITGLRRSRCREERVAVSSFFEKSGDYFEDLIRGYETVIRRPDIFKRMAPIDQIALIIGHEKSYALTIGNLGQLNSVSNRKSSSEMLRRFNAWISLSSIEKVKQFLDFGPHVQLDSYMACVAVSQNKNLPHARESELISFRLYSNEKNNQSIFALDTFRDSRSYFPAYATIQLSPQLYKHLHLFKNDEMYKSAMQEFELIIKQPAAIVPIEELIQAEPLDMNTMFTNNTGAWLEFKVLNQGRVYILIRNSKQVLFYGKAKCFKPLY